MTEADEKELHIARAIARALAKAATLNGDDHAQIADYIRKWEGIELAHNQLPDWLARAARHTYDIDVFHLANNPHFQPPGWTWCPIIDGDHRDDVFNLPRCASEDDARAKAYEWLAKRYARLAAVPSGTEEASEA